MVNLPKYFVNGRCQFLGGSAERAQQIRMDVRVADFSRRPPDGTQSSFEVSGRLIRSELFEGSEFRRRSPAGHAELVHRPAARLRIRVMGGAPPYADHGVGNTGEPAKST